MSAGTADIKKAATKIRARNRRRRRPDLDVEALCQLVWRLCDEIDGKQPRERWQPDPYV